ncbi:hypothetical protein DL770_010408 [Monosporascus sp. CRB-9-2]|nr:hypothetical protein DL770_010408 [Monosporascus sp. CRB-9-2]
MKVLSMASTQRLMTNMFEWEECHSKNGALHEIGVKKTPNSVGNHWNETEAAVQRASGIKHVWLIRQSWGIYQYMLWFQTYRNYQYWFVDSDGDEYSVNVFRPGAHEVRYNSPNPTIILVRFQRLVVGVGIQWQNQAKLFTDILVQPYAS